MDVELTHSFDFLLSGFNVGSPKHHLSTLHIEATNKAKG
jgi:hypothetical protein